VGGWSSLRERLRYKDVWNAVGLPLMILIMVVFFSGQSEFFLTESNFENIGRNIFAIALLAVGQAFVIVLGEIDISVGAIVGLTSVLVAMSVEQWGTVGALAAPAVGLTVGFINGFIITYFNVHSVIVTIGTLTAVRGLGFTITNGTPVVVDFPRPLTWLGDGMVGPLPAALVITIVVFIIAAFVFRSSTFGPKLYATGGNSEAARLAGLKTQRIKVIAFMVSGLLASLAGLIYSGRISSGQPTLGTGLELQAIAAAVVGGMALTGGRGTIGGVALGVLLLTILSNGLEISNVSSYLKELVSGIVILLAVMLDRIRARGTGSKRAAAMRARAAPPPAGEPPEPLTEPPR
jgi:ribose transport system permease protein